MQLDPAAKADPSQASHAVLGGLRAMHHEDCFSGTDAEPLDPSLTRWARRCSPSSPPRPAQEDPAARAGLAPSATEGAGGVAGREKPCVVLCGSVHPGETNASCMVKGAIDFLVSTLVSSPRPRPLATASSSRYSRYHSSPLAHLNRKDPTNRKIL